MASFETFSVSETFRVYDGISLTYYHHDVIIKEAFLESIYIYIHVQTHFLTDSIGFPYTECCASSLHALVGECNKFFYSFIVITNSTIEVSSWLPAQHNIRTVKFPCRVSRTLVALGRSPVRLPCMQRGSKFRSMTANPCTTTTTTMMSV